MKTTMLLAVAAAGALLAGPASAVTKFCKGEACPYVSPFLVQGCWNYHNAGGKRVRGIIFEAGEWVIFEIQPGGKTIPRLKNGACLRDAVEYLVDYNVNRVDERGRPRR